MTFTATIDHCSVGVGHAAPDGSIIVGHVTSTRSQDPSGDTSLVEKDQRKQLKLLGTRGRVGWKGPTIYQPKNDR